MRETTIHVDQLHEALERKGWQRDSDRLFRHPDPELPTLASIGHSSWQRIYSSPIQLGAAATRAATLLRESLAPRGPFKWISAPPQEKQKPARGKNSRSRVCLAADVPLTLGGVGRLNAGAMPLPRSFLSGIEDVTPGVENRDADVDGGLGRWAGLLNDACRPRRGGSAAKETSRRSTAKHRQHEPPTKSKEQTTTPPSSQKILERLQSAGFSAIPQGDVIHVQFEERRSFQQTRIQPTPAGGLRLDLELAALKGWQPISRVAAACIAARANETLRLVRIVWRSSASTEQLVAQVDLGPLGQAPGWLEVALDALRAAGTLLAAELPLLEDTEIAAWTIENRRS